MPKTEIVSDRELRAVRVLDAPRELVWRAFEKPEHLANWWGPNGFTNTIHTFEFRPGGAWNFVMHGPDGNDYGSEIVFVELDPPRKIVLDHSQPNFRLTFTLDDEAGRTRVTMRQVFETLEEYTRAKPYAEPANHQNLAKLADVVARLASEKA